jgi:hypothetical protein
MAKKKSSEKKPKPVPDPTTKLPRGRPTKLHPPTRDLTDNLINRISHQIIIGTHLEAACLAGGVRIEVAKDWLVRANQARTKAEFERTEMDKLCIMFQDEINWAAAQAVARSMKRIDAAGKFDWKAEAWKLTHCIDPVRFGGQKTVNHNVQGSIDHQHHPHEIDVSKLSPEVVKALYTQFKEQERSKEALSDNEGEDILYLEAKEPEKERNSDEEGT